MDVKCLATRMNNTTKILNDMNRNDSSLAIADVNKHSDCSRRLLSVCVCMYVGHDEVWSPLMCIQNIKLNLEATARETATAQSQLLKLYTEELSS